MTSNTRRVVLVAPDKFKGSLTARDVAMALASGITDAHPDLRVVTCPVADGGEGTVEAAVASGFRSRSATVRGPLGHPVDAVFATKGSTAVVELAQASGLHLLPDPGPSPQTAAVATTYGTGELLVAALDAGATRIVLGLGGSATTDGGAGMLQALGATFRDDEGTVLDAGMAHPSAIASADLAGLDPRIAEAEIVVATDVDNPLCGPRGAAAVFGPQKGATADLAHALDQDLRRWSRVLSEAGVTTSPEQRGRRSSRRRGLRRPRCAASPGTARGRRRPRPRRVREPPRRRLPGRHGRGFARRAVPGRQGADRRPAGGAGAGGADDRRRRPLHPRAADVLARTGFQAVHTLQDREPDLTTCILEAARLLREVGRELTVPE